MDKINFANLPSTTTPINATNLNQLQTNVDNGKVDKDVIYWNDNYNNCTTTGIYLAETGLANSPNTNYSFFLEVYRYSSTNILQRATARAQTSSIRQTYERQLINGTWTNWLQVPQIVSGKWTPLLDTQEGVAPTYTLTTQRGDYRIIGGLLYISFYLRGNITALNGTNNYAIIKGLPYAPAEMSLGENGISVGVCYNCINTDDDVILAPYNNSIRIQANRGAAATKWKITPSGGYFALGGSGFYTIE